MKKYLLIGIIILIITAVLAWAFVESTKPLPGQAALQEGRDHEPIGTILSYKFDPPTSGNHYPAWITKGFYDEPRWDGFLVHSQEHGYIIFWYDCASGKDHNLKLGQEPESSTSGSLAQNLKMTAGGEGTSSASLTQLPSQFSDRSCENLKNQIKQVLNNDPHKLVALPRTGLTNPLVLTAWGRMLKLDTVDNKKIKEFISAFRDHGPELTDEP